MIPYQELTLGNFYLVNISTLFFGDIMRKLLLSLIAAFTTASYAGQTVPIVWPFAIGSNQANFIRVIADEANKQQDKYTFIIESKPGAGGAIAANYVKNYNGIALLSSSSSFFTRPEFYPTESHSVADFKPVMIECLGQPYSIASVKYKTLDEIKNQKSLTIGLILGSLTEVVARQFQQLLPNTQLVFVPYPGTLQPMLDMIGGHLDLTVDLPGDSVQYISTGKVTVIGASGTVDQPMIPTFYSQGFKGFDGLVGNYKIMTKANTDTAIIRELHTILSQAARNSKKLKELYAVDFCSGVDYDLAKTNEFFTQQTTYWPAKLKSLK
jgi:tripartite-type tricarboxylate transporter receptor subunit TctC